MSGDLTARDVIARTRLELDDWTGPLPEWALAYADAAAAALAAAGWELHRAGEVVPTSDVLTLAQQHDHRRHNCWIGCRDMDLLAELRVLTRQKPT